MKKDESFSKSPVKLPPFQIHGQDDDFASATLIDVDFATPRGKPAIQASHPFHPVSLPFALSQKEESIATPQPLPALEMETSDHGPAAGTKRYRPATIEPQPDRNTTVLPQIAFDGGDVTLTTKTRERYETLSSLGEGGVGEVMLVQDHDIQRRVAMKQIKKSVKDEIKLARFVEEIKTVGQLEHPNIVPIHDVGLDDTGNHYFTMKYVEGETLKDVIKQLHKGNPAYHKRYNYERRTQIFIEILQAIGFAHDRGIIHRDLKPANIMIGAYGEVQVMDWGIAKQFRGDARRSEPDSDCQKALADESIRPFETNVGSMIGTPAYMSPEQATGLNDLLDQRSDTYSLCVLFYEFLNLRHPLQHKRSLQELIWGILDEAPLDSEKHKHAHQGPVPRELCFFLRKGLKKDPRDRFQSVHEMLEELQGNLEGRIGVYCPSTFLKRGSHGFGHFLDNHRVLGVVVFILLLGFLGMGMWHSLSLAMGWT